MSARALSPAGPCECQLAAAQGAIYLVSYPRACAYRRGGGGQQTSRQAGVGVFFLQKPWKGSEVGGWMQAD